MLCSRCIINGFRGAARVLPETHSCLPIVTYQPAWNFKNCTKMKCFFSIFHLHVSSKWTSIHGSRASISKILPLSFINVTYSLICPHLPQNSYMCLIPFLYIFLRLKSWRCFIVNSLIFLSFFMFVPKLIENSLIWKLWYPTEYSRNCVLFYSLLFVPGI